MVEPASERTPPDDTTEDLIDLGDRVIVASAKDRSRTALGTVVARDPYPDRDAVVGVLHEDRELRWHRRDALRALGHRMSTANLTADLESMGLAGLIGGAETPEEVDCA